jgi:hypothetical protein
MKIKSLVTAVVGSALLISAISANANSAIDVNANNAYNIGALDAAPYSLNKPYTNNVSVLYTASSFLDVYNFSLNNTNLVSNSVNQLTLSIGAINVLNINNLTMDLYNSSNGMLAGISGVTSSGQLTTVLANGSYYIDISGTATGTGGGIYTLSAIAQPVPEPGAWLLLSCGLCLIGYSATRSKNI